MRSIEDTSIPIPILFLPIIDRLTDLEKNERNPIILGNFFVKYTF